LLTFVGDTEEKMGGAVSSGESNDDLIDNLLKADFIKVSPTSKEIQ